MKHPERQGTARSALLWGRMGRALVLLYETRGSRPSRLPILLFPACSPAPGAPEDLGDRGAVATCCTEGVQ
jgi:hypothetical protein